MVCDNGSVKSLMAASIFNRRANERGLPFHAISRGMNPDAAVPAPIAEALGRDGFDVSHFVPSLATTENLTSAARRGNRRRPINNRARAVPTRSRWDDVPAARMDYAAARASIEKPIRCLATEQEIPNDPV
jgi:protein-tyrosine-phosphatase